MLYFCAELSVIELIAMRFRHFFDRYALIIAMVIGVVDDAVVVFHCGD